MNRLIFYLSNWITVLVRLVKVLLRKVHRKIANEYLTVMMKLLHPFPIFIKGEAYYPCKCCGGAYSSFRWKQFVNVSCRRIGRNPTCKKFRSSICKSKDGCGKFLDEKTKLRRVSAVIRIGGLIFKTLKKFNHCIITYSTDTINALEVFLSDKKNNATHDICLTNATLDFSKLKIVAYQEDEDEMLQHNIMIYRKNTNLREFKRVHDITDYFVDVKMEDLEEEKGHVIGEELVEKIKEMRERNVYDSSLARKIHENDNTSRYLPEFVPDFKHFK